MKCKICGKEVELRIGWKTITFRCTSCGKVFLIKEYINDVDENTWEAIARRPCNRA